MKIKILKATKTDRQTFLIEFIENDSVLKVVETNKKSPFTFNQLAKNKVNQWISYILNGVYIVKYQRLI